MPCYTRMKRIFMQGVIWLCLLNLGIVLSAIEPGYLDFDNLPDTNFSCVGKVIGGYYADLETNCQMFHVCTIGQLDEPMDIRFLCLNGTVFDQETRVCERVDEVDCSKSEKFYHLNLELYGNTAPPILEESEETESPIISSTTSTTTTSRPTTTTRPTRATFYTTSAPTLSTTHSTPKVITSNQFPINSGPDIRFNPEEINIRLTPGSPPIIKSPAIKSPSVSYQQQAFNGGDARITVTTHTAVYKDDKIGTSQKSVSSTQKPKSVVSYGLTHSNNQQIYHHKPFDYNFQQTENSDIDYHTDLPSGEYSYHDDHMYDQMNYQSSNKKPQTQVFMSSTTKRIKHNQPSYVSSTVFPPALKQQQQQYNYQRTDKPNLQLPVPLFPTLSPLTFSSPAPFTLTRHFEQKRSNDHQQRPRIIVSASASVSDASGRRLNYSLGTIGTSHLIPKAPHTYDEYKEDDVGLDPFYHDVPKVKSRQKRDLTLLEPNPTSSELNEKKVDAENSAIEEVSSEETVSSTHWTPPEYVDDNYEPLTYNISDDIPEQNKTEIVDLKLNEKLNDKLNDTKTPEVEYEYYYEYIDDNYEPSMYDEIKNTTEMLITTESVTEPSVQTTTQDASTEVTVTEPYQDLMVSDATTHVPEQEVELGGTTTEEFILNIDVMERRSDQIRSEIVDEQAINPTTENVPPTMENVITTTVNDALTSENFASTIEDYVETTTQEITTQTTENNEHNSTQTPQDTTYFSTTNFETTIGTTTEAISTTITENMTESPTPHTESTTFNTESTTPFVESTTISTETTTTPNEEITSTISSITEDNLKLTTGNPTTEYIPETTTFSTITTNRYSFLKPREPSFKRNPKTRPTPRHRFSSPSIHISPSVLKLGSKMADSNLDSISEESVSEELSHRIRTNNLISDSKHILTTASTEDVTDASLSKSANPTEPKTTKSSSMPTTPITKTLFIPRRFTYDLTRSFNCFGKELNQFYEDPRDCRLFHYCTPGYTKTQVLDMKYVCDYGTYFDSDKLICTKIKPQRCKVSGKQV